MGPQGPAGPAGPVGPSGIVINYNLAAGACSSPINVALDTPVLVIANNTTSGDQGIASVTVEAFETIEGGLVWSGVNSPNTANPNPTTTGGSTQYDDPNPQVMLTFDYGSQMTLVDQGGQFVIHNSSSIAQTGTLWILTAPPA